MNLAFAAVLLFGVLLCHRIPASGSGRLAVFLALFSVAHLLSIIVGVSDYSIVGSIYLSLGISAAALLIQAEKPLKWTVLLPSLVLSVILLGMRDRGLAALPVSLGIAVAWALRLRLGQSHSGSSTRKWFDRVALFFIILWFGFVLRRLTYGCPNPLPDIEAGLGALVPAKYARMALRSFLSTATFCGGDFYISRSFWGGFGWLETIPPQWFLLALQGIFAVGIVVGFWAERRLNCATVIRGIRYGFLVIATIVVWHFAEVCLDAKINLHGRYLLGAYILVMAVGAAGWFWGLCVWFGRGRALKVAKPGAVLFLSGSLSYSLDFILRRYF